MSPGSDAYPQDDDCSPLPDQVRTSSPSDYLNRTSPLHGDTAVWQLRKGPITGSLKKAKCTYLYRLLRPNTRFTAMACCWSIILKKPLVQWFLGQASSLGNVFHTTGNLAWRFWIPVGIKCILVTLWWESSYREVVKVIGVIWPLLSATNDEMWLCTKKPEMRVLLLKGEGVPLFVKACFMARAQFTGQELNSYFSFFFV